MSRQCVLLLICLLAAGVHDSTVADDGNETAIADQELLLRITAGVESVAPGKAFPLTVVRTWSKELVPEDWSDQALAPLTVRLVETTWRENERHIEETRHYRCYAFSLEDITVAAPSFSARPRSGGPPLAVSGNAVELRLEPLLDRAAPGPPELPGNPLPQPFDWSMLLGGGVAVLAALLLLVATLRWRGRQPAAESVTPPLPPHLRALQRLERLREREPEGLEETQTFHVEASALVREYIKEQFRVHAPEMSSEECLAAPETERQLEASHRVLLSEFLEHCDRVKFARHAPAVPEREHLLDLAAVFLRDTRPETGSARAAAVEPAGGGAA